MENKLTFRYAVRKDIPLILQFIRDLAEYEKLLNEVVADEATLEEWIFDQKKAEVIFHGKRKRSWICAVLPQLFYLFGQSGTVFGRPLCSAGISQ